MCVLDWRWLLHRVGFKSLCFCTFVYLFISQIKQAVVLKVTERVFLSVGGNAYSLFCSFVLAATLNQSVQRDDIACSFFRVQSSLKNNFMHLSLLVFRSQFDVACIIHKESCPILTNFYVSWLNRFQLLEEIAVAEEVVVGSAVEKDQRLMGVLQRLQVGTVACHLVNVRGSLGRGAMINKRIVFSFVLLAFVSHLVPAFFLPVSFLATVMAFCFLLQVQEIVFSLLFLGIILMCSAVVPVLSFSEFPLVGLQLTCKFVQPFLQAIVHLHVFVFCTDVSYIFL